MCLRARYGTLPKRSPACVYKSDAVVQACLAQFGRPQIQATLVPQISKLSDPVRFVLHNMHNGLLMLHNCHWPLPAQVRHFLSQIRARETGSQLDISPGSGGRACSSQMCHQRCAGTGGRECKALKGSCGMRVSWILRGASCGQGLAI